MRMMAAKMGQRYLIIKLKMRLRRKGLPSSVTSSSIFSTPMTRDTSRQVAMAAMGIMTELVRKSKKSRNCIPKTVTPRQRAVAQSRQTAQHQHDDADEDGGLLTLPAQLVLEGGDGAFRQGDGAGHGGEKHQHEEQDAHHRAEPHAVKDLRDGDEHEGRAGLQGVRVAAGEGEDRRNDHQARHDGNGRVEDLHILGGAPRWRHPSSCRSRR